MERKELSVFILSYGARVFGFKTYHSLGSGWRTTNKKWYFKDTDIVKSETNIYGGAELLIVRLHKDKDYNFFKCFVGQIEEVIEV